eukprot:6847000-Pyramimonas_sp.AAC.1
MRALQLVPRGHGGGFSRCSTLRVRLLRFALHSLALHLYARCCIGVHWFRLRCVVLHRVAWHWMCVVLHFGAAQ